MLLEDTFCHRSREIFCLFRTSRQKLRALALCALAFLLAGSPAAAAPGDIAGKYPVNEDDPKSSVPPLEVRNAEPIEFAHHLQDLIARAEGAFRKQEYERSAKFYEAVAYAVPDRAISFSRLCVAYGRLGRVELAAANCGKALGLGGAKVIDHIRFVNFTLQKDTFTSADAEAIESSLAHLRAHADKHPQPLPAQQDEPAPAAGEAQAPGQPGPSKPASEPGDKQKSKEELLQAFMEHRMERVRKDKKKLAGEAEDGPTAKLNPMHLPTEIEILSCKLAARLQDAERLNQCMDALRKLQAKEALLLPFAWSHALIQKDSARAEHLLDEAKRLGLGEQTIAAMLIEHEKAFAAGQRLRWALGGLGLVVLLAAGTWGVRRFGRRRKTAVPVEASSHRKSWRTDWI